MTGLKVTLERLPESRVQLDIEVDQERLEKSLQVAYRKVAGKVRIPGFRPGKAPRHVVERMIGREGLIREALDALVPDAYNDAIKEHDIDAIDQPELEILELEPVRFKATVPVRPTIDLGDYKSLRVEQAPVVFDDEELERQMLRLRRQHATHVPVERGAEWNDHLIASVIGKFAPDAEATGEEIEKAEAAGAEAVAEAEASIVVDSEAEAAEVAVEVAEAAEMITFIEDEDADFALREGEELLVPGLSEAFLGMTAGEKKDLVIDVPEGFRIERLAGKAVHIALELKEIKEEQLPELDEEFADSVNAMFKSYDELREDIARQLRERTQNEADNAYRNKAIELLLEGATLEYPTIMVDREIDNVIRDSTGSDVQSYRAYLQRVGRSEEEFRETFREAAAIRVRRGLVLGKLADTEEIAATVDDIQGELDKMFSELAEDDGRFRELIDSEMGRDTVRRDLINRKTMERLLAIARGEVSDVAPAAETVTEPIAGGEVSNATPAAETVTEPNEPEASPALTQPEEDAE